MKALRARHKVQGTRYKAQGTRHKAQGTRYKAQDMNGERVCPGPDSNRDDPG